MIWSTFILARIIVVGGGDGEGILLGSELVRHSDGFIVARELIWPLSAIISPVPAGLVERIFKGSTPTFHRMHMIALSAVCTQAFMQIPVLGKPLPLQLLTKALVLSLVVLAAAQPLVVIEYDRAYRLFGAILAHDVVVDAPLQVARIELGHTKGGLGKDRTSSILLARIIAGGETRVEVLRPAGSKGEIWRIRESSAPQAEGGWPSMRNSCGCCRCGYRSEHGGAGPQ